MFCIERDDPATPRLTFGRALKRHMLVEMVEDVFVIHAQAVKQRADRKLALAVDPDVDDVLCIEFEIEPRTAIGNDPRGKQIFARRVGFAAIMVEQYARRTVHLRYDNALCAVDEERAVVRHERHVAHVNVLLLDIQNRTRFGVGVDLEHDQAQRHLHLRRVGDPALTAFLDVVFGVFEFVMNEIEFRGSGKIADRENAAQRFFEARYITDRRVGAQELLVTFALHLDQVGHVDNFVDVTEDFADAFLTRQGCRSGTGCHNGS